MKKSELILAFSLIFLVSCSSIGMEEAENSAKEFVKTNVKFRVQNNTINNPYVFIAERKKENGNFVFSGMASTTYEQETKSAKFTIVVDGKGNVILFNNQSVPGLSFPNQNYVKSQ